MWAAAAIAAASLASAYFGSQQQNANARAQSSAQAQANAANIAESESARLWQANQNDAARGFNEKMQWVQYDQNAALQREGQRFNAEQTGRAMDFDAYMSNTAYQRGMQDMKAAGLNPILAYQQGGASSPTVAPATSPAASVGQASSPTSSTTPARVESTYAGRVSSASQMAGVVTSAMQAAANVGQTEASTDLIKQQQREVIAREENIRVNTALQGHQAVTEGVRPDLIRAQTRSEGGRPALIGAQAAEAGASAANLAARTETERENPSRVREETRRAGAEANYIRTQDEQRRLYGPPGTVSGTVGGISQVLDSIRRSLQ